MKSVERLFGSKFAAAVKLSPMLSTVITLLQAAGISLEVCKQKDVAYFDRKKRKIYICKRTSKGPALGYQLVSLAHEYSHALVRITVDPKLGDDKDTWVNERLEEETEAILHEFRVIKELSTTRFAKCFSPAELRWFYIFEGGEKACVEAYLMVAQYVKAGLEVELTPELLEIARAGGRTAVRAFLNITPTSNTGELYPEYYAGWFDEEMKRLAWHKKRADAKAVRAQETTEGAA